LRLKSVLWPSLIPCLVIAAGHPALAQRSAENAVATADDAFGSTVGTEKIGIYNDMEVRGFNPVRAGNLRIEGVYFDQVAGLTGRVRAGSRIRVGIAALDYPFPAPSGIVDYNLRPAGDKPAGSLALLRQAYGGVNVEVDVSAPIIPGRLSLAGGITRNHDEAVDGSHFINYAAGLLPRLKFGHGEVMLLASHILQAEITSRVVITAPGAFLPPMPEPRRYLGQDWAKARAENTNLGFTAKADLGSAWSMRVGGFQSSQLKHRGFSEIFVVADPAGNARHSVVADPRQLSRSYSGEVQLAWRDDGPTLRHRLLFNLRARDKTAETGGADSRDLGPVRLGDFDPEVKPVFTFRQTDQSDIRQITGGVGYVGRYKTLAQLNLGLQKTDYRASFERLGRTTSVTDRPWLYNATLVISPSPRWLVYGGTVRGLEESGVAPESASNRNETLPASRTIQYDGGARVKLWTTQLVVSAFQIEKPYFSFDATNRFTDLGQVRHRGVEASISGPVGKRLNIVAGAVFMRPEVTGEARTLGRVGPRPVGVATTLLRLDADYRTPFEGLTLTGSVVRTGPRAASARPYAALGGAQLFTPAFTTLDLGMRYRFKLEDHPISVRVLMSNITDSRSWKIVAANSYQLNETRRLAVNILADF
jgi:iron complex outermembrane receptor protein